MESKLTGVLYVYFLKKGFGFISTTDDAGVPTGKYFMYHESVISGTPSAGKTVKFSVNPVKEGRLPSAVAVEVV
jgi:cold shock CspA family protein